MEKVFKYDKCSFCAKNYSITSLICLQSNSIVIGDENVLFTELILDTCFIQVDEARMKYICENCKEQVVMFHMFKRDVKKYNNFNENIKKLDVLIKIDDLLNNLDDINDLSVYQHDNTILITKNCDDMGTEHLQNDDNYVIEEVPVKCHLEEEYIEEMQEDDVLEIASSEVKTEKPTSNFLCKSELSDSVNSSDGPTPAKRKKYAYKINTNDSLSPEQLKWIKQQVAKSEIIVDGRKLYKCQLCSTILQIPGSLKKHLRDSHLLKSRNEEEERQQKRAFKDEINNSKILVESIRGNETIWKCQRCTENRIFRSEGGLKVHLRYNHIKGQVIDADFIASCKISLESDDQYKNAWQCPECTKILRSRDGLRNHMKLEHSDLVEKLQSTSSHKELDKNTIKTEEMSMLSRTKSTDGGSFIQLEKRESKVHSNALSSVICETCGLKFFNGTTKREKSLEIHQQLHIILKVVSQSYELPKCDQCKVMFSNNEDLTNHIVSHDPEEVFSSYGLSFMVATKYKDANGTANNDDYEKWKCGHCSNVRFKDEIECIEHQMILHSKQLICPVDYLEFNGIRGLSQFSIHMKNKHPEMFPELVISCSYCKQVFPNVFEKLAHMKNNCEFKKYFCDHCSLKFFTKNQLLRHLKIVSGVISYTCDVCSKNCTSGMDLKLHYRSHTNEKTYQCTFPNCSKVFKTPAARSSHIEIHSFIEYECSDCKAIFKQRALLQRHLKNAKCKGVTQAKPVTA